MVHRNCNHIFLGLAALAICCAPVWAIADSDSTVVAVDATSLDDEAEPATEPIIEPTKENTGLTYLVPSLEGVGYRVSDGKRQFKNRFSFSPGIGKLGKEELFAFRLAYNPNSWLGYEINLGHNPAESLHAMLHTFNVLVRYPLPWRAQPYATVGYGMFTVFPGQAINADPVTKNALTAGGGLELYVRDDVALRGEMRSANILGQQLGLDGTVNYSYREYTLGFIFYRGLGR